MDGSPKLSPASQKSSWCFSSAPPLDQKLLPAQHLVSSQNIESLPSRKTFQLLFCVLLLRGADLCQSNKRQTNKCICLVRGKLWWRKIRAGLFNLLLLSNCSQTKSHEFERISWMTRRIFCFQDVAEMSCSWGETNSQTIVSVCRCFLTWKMDC